MIYRLILLILLSNFVCYSQKKVKYIRPHKFLVKKHISPLMRSQWQHLDVEKDTIAGTSLNRAYAELLKNKKGKEVLVAVIDTDFDIQHEDLKQAIWVNKKEIPNNGIDDDKNGYVDDVQGWNFLGNSKGESISYGSITPIRVLRYLKKKYPNYPNFNGNKADSLKNERMKNVLNEDLKEISFLKDNAHNNLKLYRENLAIVEKEFHKNKFTFEQIDSLYVKCKKENSTFTPNVKTLQYYISIGRDLQALKNDSLLVLEQEKISYNIDYNDRAIIGDNDQDINDKPYGNNNVYKNAYLTEHGTQVTGLIAATRKNKIGIQGFSDYIKIIPIIGAPFSGYENEKDVNLAIHYAVDHGAKVINMSFGNTFGEHQDWIKEAFLYAEKHDVLLVAGAGNGASNNDKKAFHPIDYDEKTGIEFCNNFIKVGASSYNLDKSLLAYFTNYGKQTVDLFAPGYYMKTTDARVGYSYQDGTSLAGPIVAGVAALIRSYYPKLTAAQVKKILLDSSVKYDLEVQVPGEKEGTLKPFKELSKSGGVVNAYNALLMAEEMSRKK